MEPRTRRFILSLPALSLIEDKLRLNIDQVNLSLYSACIIFTEDKLRLNIDQVNLSLYSACIIFAQRK